MALEAGTGTRLNAVPTENKADKGCRFSKPKEIRQKADNWCWAASIESARLTIKKGWRKQHLIVARHESCGESRCRNHPTHDDCDKTISREELTCLWREEGFGGAEYSPAKVSFATLANELCEGRLVLLELNNRHVILVYGWEVDPKGTEIVLVLDSDRSEAPGWWNFRDLDLYNGGKWGPWTGTCRGLGFDGSETC
jgi:hypothetical protein